MFCLSGNESVITADLWPHVDTSQGNWKIGLIDFSVYNSVPNVEAGKNNLFIIGHEIISIPTGSYELNDINSYIQKAIKLPNSVSITANNNTLQTEVYSNLPIDFTHPQCIGSLLGFSQRVLEPNKSHKSDRPVSIQTVNLIRIECNLVTGSYLNGRLSHVLYEIYPNVPPGYKIYEIVKNPIYLSINTKRIEKIVLSFKDQNDRPINFRGESVNIKLHLISDN